MLCNVRKERVGEFALRSVLHVIKHPADLAGHGVGVVTDRGPVV